MRKKSTRFLSAALAVCMMLSVLPVGAFAAEPENSVSVQADPVDAEYVEINDTNFPDPFFQQYVKENIDTADATTGQKDGKLSKTERDQVTAIRITNKNCTDLTGIAYFPNLQALYCAYNKLTVLDMSENPALQVLDCGNNEQLTTLNVSQNAELLELDCRQDIRLTTLDVGENLKLQILNSENGGLRTLNLNGAEALQNLNCDFNYLSELDVSHNLNLQILRCWDNSLTTLDVSKNRELVKLDCSDNSLTTLDVTRNPELQELTCRGNSLTELDVSKNLKLKSLALDNNQLTKLDVSNNKNLSYLNCKSNHLTSLDLTQTKIGENCFYAAFNSYTVTVNDDLTFDLDNMPDGFDLKNVISWNYGTVSEDGKTLTFDGHEAYYWYNTGCASHKYNQYLMSTSLKQVNRHEYKWEHNEKKHWRTCALNHCPGLTDEQKAEAPHDYTNAKDADCNTCGYMRPMYTVTTGENVTAELEDEVLNAPVAADTEVHLTATVPEGQHFTGWTVKVNGEEKDPSTFLTTPDADDPTKVTFIMPDKDVEVKAKFEGDPVPNVPADPVDPSGDDNIKGALSAVVVGAVAGAIIYETGTGIYRVINMPGIPMPSNRIELAELLWEHADKPEPVSTALYSDIDEDDTDAQKAAHWAVEQDLMQDDADNNKFNPHFPVSKLRTCLTWNAAKEKGLFDTDKPAE